MDAREVAALALTNEATRLFLRGDLMVIADSHGEQVEVDGVIYQRHQPGTVTYLTLCGALVSRHRGSRHNSRAGHPASRRCSSLTYAQ